MKPGDRIKSTKDWLSSQIQAPGGAFVTFDLYRGDEGLIHAEDTPGSGIWVVVFDKAPTEYALVSEMWLEPASPSEVPIDPLQAIFEPTVQDCTCSLTVIMRDGCMCGHIKRYIPPHLRDKK